MPLRLRPASIHQLNIFKCVVENGGFSAAQGKLNMSAASISLGMKELEGHIGMKLCQRGRSGFKITEHGQRVYEAAEVVFAAMDDLNLALSHIRKELVGEIRIAIQDNLATSPDFLLPESLAQFNARENQVSFRFDEAMSSEQAHGVLDGRYHLAIGVFQHRVAGLRYEKLFDEEVGLYCAHSHPLFSVPDDEIDLQAIQSFKHVGAGHIEGILQPIEKLASTPSAVTENMDALAILLLSGGYLGRLPKHFAKLWVDKNLMKRLMPDQISDTVELCLITKRGAHQPHIVDTFLKDLTECHNLGQCPMSIRSGTNKSTSVGN